MTKKNKRALKRMSPANKLAAATVLADRVTEVKFARGTTASVKELILNTVFASFNDKGDLLGVYIFS